MQAGSSEVDRCAPKFRRSPRSMNYRRFFARGSPLSGRIRTFTSISGTTCVYTTRQARHCSETFGIDAQRTRQSRWGLFDLEHHLWYLREIHVGDEVTIHCRLLARTVKRFHGTLLLVNRTRGQLASAMEFLSTCADLDARATAALPSDVAACMDVLIERHHKLSWPAPVSGVMAP